MADETNLLAQVEAVLLPKIVRDDGQANDKKEFSSTPTRRFLDFCNELAIGEHIRAMQTIYRDAFDEQRLFEELRGFQSGFQQIPTKALMERIIEGRVRMLALAKLSFRPDSEVLYRTRLDLGASYAHHGMWQQAHEAIVDVVRVLEKSADRDTSEAITLSLDCAQRVLKVYKCLRVHVQKNAGKVFPSVVTEIVAELEGEMSSNHPDTPHPSKLAAALYAFFHTSLKVSSKKSASGESLDGKTSGRADEFRSWGQVVDFLRHRCDIMRIWLDTAEAILLPQTKATLSVPFRFCDASQRQLAHCLQLASETVRFPAAMKLLSGSPFLKKLAEMNAAVPIDDALLSMRPSSPGAGPGPLLGKKAILYELPLTFEEFVCLYLTECRNYVAQQFPLMKIQAMTLMGICLSYLDRLEEAEPIFIRGLHLLESINLDMELGACELFNSIAQMMISKYTKWLANKKQSLKQEIEHWMDHDEEGKRQVRIQIRNIKRQGNFQSPVMPLAELQFQAKEILLKIKFREYFSSSEENHETNEMKKLLDVASRYLIRSYEILETYHQSNQAIVGTSCLAIASVQNLLKDYEECREWLLRAIRIFEKSQPLPIRAISFTQIQLANVLKKLTHEDEARRVLVKALEFHRSQARIGLMQQAYSNPLQDGNQDHLLPSHLSEPGGLSPEKLLLPLILKNSSLFEEIDISAKLLREVIDLSIKCGDKWEASLYAEDLSKLMESAFGWDSTEAAETYREVSAPPLTPHLPLPNRSPLLVPVGRSHLRGHRELVEGAALLPAEPPVLRLHLRPLPSQVHAPAESDRADEAEGRRSEGGRRQQLRTSLSHPLSSLSPTSSFSISSFSYSPPPLTSLISSSFLCKYTGI
jgi:hypothetical protein